MVCRFLAVGLVALAAGCSSNSVSQGQCLSGDWQTLGYNDGVAGFLSSRLLAHYEACDRHGVVPDRDAYLAGFNQGLAIFCKPANGLAVGKRGGGYHHACPADLEPAFLAAYREGRRLYRVQREVSQLRRAIEHAERDIQSLEADILDAAAAQLDPALTVQRRVELFNELKEMSEIRDDLQAKLPGMKSELSEKEVLLASLRESVPAV